MTITVGIENYQQVASQPPEVEGTVEVKTSSKSKCSKQQKILQQKERTPEQQQVTLQRFKQSK